MSGEGARGGHNFLSLFYVSTNFKRIFLKKNRRTLFGSLKCRQTLFKAQILFHKAFYDFFRFTRPSKIVNAFPSFAIQMRVANWRPTYLICTFRLRVATASTGQDCWRVRHRIRRLALAGLGQGVNLAWTLY